MAADPGGGAGKDRASEPTTVAFSTANPAIGSRAVAKQRGRSATSLSVLSHARQNPKWSFGSASRFPEPRKPLRRSRSEPGVGSGATSTTASDAGGLSARRDQREVAEVSTQEPSKAFSSTEAGTFFESPEYSFDPGWGADAGQGSKDFTGASGSTSAPGGRSAVALSEHLRTAKLKAPRIDGSHERSLDVRSRAAHPRAKYYEPAATIGAGTALSYNKSPQFSFGGGASRMPEFSGKKEHLAHLAAKVSPAKAAKAALAQTLPGGITTSALEAGKPKKTKKRELNRGFGTEPRLRMRGGAYELPISPGPNYEVMRFGDPTPQWVASSVLPWGHRTSDRPTLRNPTASDVGPGEYIAHHPFKAAANAPIIGHPLKDFKRPEWHGLDPTRYDPNHDTIKNIGPSYSVGTGDRPDAAGLLKKASPGPAQYSPEDAPTKHKAPSLSFGKSQRTHESELIDPDEPPGPGSHKVRKDPHQWSMPNAGMPKDMKLRYVPGLGPNTPGPGTYNPEDLTKPQGRTISCPRPRPIETIPGPADYAPSHELTHSAAPQWAPMESRTSVRKPPWREPEVVPEVKWNHGEKPEFHDPVDRLSFKPGGPKWSMPPRRETLRGFVNESESMTILSSIG